MNQGTLPLESQKYRQLITMLRLLIVVLSFYISMVHCMEIKWTSTKNDDEAANAPRSQKYWDEHNIKRPDYAKTDAEVWAERRGGKSRSPLPAALFIMAGVGVGYVYYKDKPQELQQLKDQVEHTVIQPLKSWFAATTAPKPNDAAEIRNARLSRFEVKQD
jgi:hypothetical protein